MNVAVHAQRHGANALSLSDSRSQGIFGRFFFFGVRAVLTGSTAVGLSFLVCGVLGASWGVSAFFWLSACGPAGLHVIRALGSWQASRKQLFQFSIQGFRVLGLRSQGQGSGWLRLSVWQYFVNH